MIGPEIGNGLIDIVFFADGDGDFHPTFEWDIDANLNPGKVTKSGEAFFDAG